MLIAVSLLLALSLVWPLGAGVEESAVVSLRITDRDGGLLREVQPDGRGLPVSLDDVAPAAVDALLAVEDRHFYRHPGINPLALVRALAQNVRHGRTISGGSTITMQAARAIRGETRRGVWDKLAEMHLALRLEWHLSKKEILELWLNRVAFGNRAHGIESAARLYFGKSARDLSLAEAALLVGLPQSPSRYNPLRHPERAFARQRRVLAAMARAGKLTPQARADAETMPVQVVAPEQVFRAPHFTEALLARVEKRESRETEKTPRRPNAPTQKLRTTIDPGLQAAVENLVRGHLRLLRDESVTQAAVVVLENATGAIRAYVGSADFWGRNGGQNDGVQQRRQPGSALKPFTYAHAISTHRYTAASVLADVETQVIEAGGAFIPENYDRRYHGPVPLREALANSYNVPAVRIVREVGPAALLQAYRQAGFASLRRESTFYGVGLTLGNGEVQLLELARAYAGLARGGHLPAVRWIEAVTGKDGVEKPVPIEPPQPNGISPEIAYLITDILKDPEARAEGFGRGGPLELPFPCAVKTGTTKDYRDNWTVGYTPRYTVAVWVGNFDNAPMRWVSGVSGAGPLFKAVMLHLGPGGAFAQPPGLVHEEICPASGQPPGAACPLRRREYFLPGTVPADTCAVHQRLRLDTRSGLLADADTPAEAVEEKTFTVYPPLFHDWMRQQGMPFPPQVSRAAVVSDAEARYSDRLRITYPASGTTFHLDPVLRAEYQQVRLRGTADTDLLDVAWYVNDERLAASWAEARWQLLPGAHHIELRAVTPEGERLRSRPSLIRVNGNAHSVKSQ